MYHCLYHYLYHCPVRVPLICGMWWCDPPSTIGLLSPCRIVLLPTNPLSLHINQALSHILLIVASPSLLPRSHCLSICFSLLSILSPISMSLLYFRSSYLLLSTFSISLSFFSPPTLSYSLISHLSLSQSLYLSLFPSLMVSFTQSQFLLFSSLLSLLSYISVAPPPWLHGRVGYDDSVLDIIPSHCHSFRLW